MSKGNREIQQGGKNIMSSYTEDDLLLNRSADNEKCPFCQVIDSFSYDGKDFICTSCEATGTKQDLLGYFQSQKKTATEEVEQLQLNAGNQETLQTVNKYYHKILFDNDKVKEFLVKHKLYNVEAIKVFKLGYCDRTLGKRIPKSTTKAGKTVRENLVRTGLYTRQAKNELFRGALTIPIFNQDGTIHQMYGRKITAHKKKDVKQEMYLDHAFKDFWNPTALNSKKLILCSNLIDALSFWVHGFKNVTCTFGENGWTEELLNKLLESQVKEVIIAFENHQKISKHLMQEGMVCYQIDLGNQQTVNDVAVSTENPISELSMILNGAEFIGGGHFKESESSTISSTELEYETKGEDIFFTFGEHKYRIRGLDRNKSYDCLRVNVQIIRDDFYYTDTLDLLHAKNRTYFVKQCVKETGLSEYLIKKEIGKILMKLEDIQQERINGIASDAKAHKMSERDKEEALKYLKDKNLIQNISADYEESGLLVGEQDTALTAYLCMTSRKLAHPLPLIIQAGSSAGKSSLMSATLKLMPSEDVESFTAMSEQSLYYMNKDMKHKILAIAEDHGMKGLEYSIKMLESEGGLKIASTGKESKNAKFKTETYELEGPIQVSFTTTANILDEELANRSIVLGIREDAEQTGHIHDLMRQAETLEGLLSNQHKEHIISVHNNAQRLLSQDIQVINPYADKLKFPTYKTRLRRDFPKYLNLIKVIAFLHQFQREVKTVKSAGETIKYIEVVPQDIAIANRLAEKIFSHCLDEVSNQTRNIFNIIKELAKNTAKAEGMQISEVHLSKVQILEHVPCKGTQLSGYLKRLCALEFLIAHRDSDTRLIRYEVSQLSKEKTELGLTTMEELNPNHEFHIRVKKDQIRPKNGSHSARKNSALSSTVDSGIRPKTKKTTKPMFVGGDL